MSNLALETFKPPIKLPQTIEKPSIFLGGSIEMGTAVNWQSHVEEASSDLNVALLNPRRDHWDSSWKQSIDNPLFKGQVEWELEGLDRATMIVFYFAPDTKSPVTLLELGLYAASGRVVVCCPEGFWRKGNVDIICEKFGIPQVSSLDKLCVLIRSRFEDRS